MLRLRSVFAAFVAALITVAPASAARPIVDLHKLDAYFALFASDSNVPWKATKVRLDTYTSAPVAFSVYQVHPGDVVTAGSNARPRAIDTRRLHPIAHFTYTPPGGYQFQSNHVNVPLGSREGFFVVEARRGNVGEQVWINRTRVGLVAKETPGELLLYGSDLGTGRALARMRVQFVVNGRFMDRETDAHGIVRWNRSPRPVFALAQWGNSYAFTSLLPQPPLPTTIVGVRTDSAVVHAGENVRVVGFARVRDGAIMKAARGEASVSMRLGGTLVSDVRVPLDAAGAFAADVPVPAMARSGDYALLAQVGGGVGGATVHVDASAGGLTLGISSPCESAGCDAASDVPVTITSSRGDVPVHVTVIRSPHVYVGYTPQRTPWATTKWVDRTVRTNTVGKAVVEIPHPTDRLSSTYGIRAESGGASAVTRLVVPTSRVAVRLHLDREEQTLGTPVNFDVYANDIRTGKPLSGARIVAQLVHGTSTQQQIITLDGDGHAHATFTSPQLGTNLVFARLDGASPAMDAGQVDVVPQATGDASSSGSANAHIALDKDEYHAGDEVHVTASLPGAVGDALVTLDSAIGSQSVTARVSGGVAHATLRLRDAPGDLRIGAVFVHDGSIEWTSVPLSVDAPGRPELVPLALPDSSFAPGATAPITLRDARGGAGTIVVRISRGAPSGSALFDTAPDLLAIGVAATEVSAPGERTWHPWVDSTGVHAQVLGFVRRTQPPQNLAISQADTEVVSWNVLHDDGQPVTVQLPAQRGRYTLSVLKITDDGRVLAASTSVLVR